MNKNKFDVIVNDTLRICKSLLCSKGKEYSVNKDRLRAFKIAGNFTASSSKEALWGMAVKHLTSITDGIYGTINLSMDKWDEKIIDMINYLILLRALIIEEKGGEKKSVDV